MGILYIVATPIGNLKDITLRALEILKQVDLIICEDTRQTKKLLQHYQITTPVISFYKFQTKKGSQKPPINFEKIIFELSSQKDLALLTDAGTPGISDPGNQIVAEADKNQIAVIPISGVSSLTTIASVAGIDLSKFMFLGFSPRKKGRNKFFEEIASSKHPAIYFESPFRLIKNLELLSVIARSSDKKSERRGNLVENSEINYREIKLVVGRELTKVFEEIVRGSLDEVLQYFQKNKDKIKGEIVIIVY